jgi:AAA domain
MSVKVMARVTMTADGAGNGVDHGWREHPDFLSLSDDELAAEEAIINDRIKWAVEDGDEERWNWYKLEMRLLNAEKARRNGGSQFVSSPKENKPCAINFPLQTWGAFLKTDFAELPYTIEGLAPDSGLVAFHGRGKDGKTTFLIHACRAIASGQPFFSKATLQKPVVYLNYEMGFAYLQTLLGAGGPCPEEAYILNRPEPVLQMATVETLMQQTSRPGVMVIDSFRGAFRLSGDAENSSGGAGLILRNLQDLAVKLKWLLIVIHHRNRSAKEGTDGISGTSDWIAAPDVIWTWARPDKAKPGTLTVEGRMPPVDPVAVQLSPEECVFMGSVEESREETDNAAILKALTDEGQQAKDIAEAIGRPASSVRKRLEALFDGGQVNREGRGKRGDPYHYSKINCAQNILLGEETKSKVEDGFEDVPK